MRIGRVELTTRRLLVLLAVMLVGLVLLTPEESVSGGGRSSFSTDPGGARIAFELAQRMRWRATRRTTTLDSVTTPADVHVVVGAQGTLGGAETHRLLEHVRAGGGLLFSIDGAGSEIADSLGADTGDDTYLMPGADAADCRGEERRARPTSTFLPPTLRAIVWRRPAPGPVTPLLESPRRGKPIVTVAGFTMGRGRVAVFSTSELFANEAMRVCVWGADVAVARALEYLRPGSVSVPTIAFDEFHHGYGTHAGSMKAVMMYLSRTASGHFLAQAIVAAFLLLVAAAPRPVVPREAERAMRRSPLEHADALALAYMDVDASRTATSRLIAGLRRRTGRFVAAGAANDAAFLDAVERRAPDVRGAVATLRRGLTDVTSGRDLLAVGQAVVDVEQALTSTSSIKA